MGGEHRPAAVDGPLRQPGVLPGARRDDDKLAGQQQGLKGFPRNIPQKPAAVADTAMPGAGFQLPFQGTFAGKRKLRGTVIAAYDRQGVQQEVCAGRVGDFPRKQHQRRFRIQVEPAFRFGGIGRSAGSTCS